MKKFIAGFLTSLFTLTLWSAQKTYQVTGPVLEVTDTKIVVQKDKEKWEMARDTNTQVKGDLKVGAKVTIKYTMSATQVESKK